jgi:hypothetical protein
MNKNSKRKSLEHRKEQKRLGIEGCQKEFKSKRKSKWKGANNVF